MPLMHWYGICWPLSSLKRGQGVGYGFQSVIAHRCLPRPLGRFGRLWRVFRSRQLTGSCPRKPGMLLHDGEQHPLQFRFVNHRRIAAMPLRLRLLDIGEDGAGDKLCLVPPLLFQKLRRHPLLGVFHVKLQGEPPRLLLLAHFHHLLFWATRYNVS